MKTTLVAFASGVLFAVGLGVSGMTQPVKVIAFLDVLGAWDPSLMFVMMGALAVTLITFPRILARGTPVLEPAFAVPPKSAIDSRLLTGAAIFGVGWGLSGYCPGPAIASISTGAPAVFAFLGATCAGMLTFEWVDRRWPKAALERT